MTNEDVITVINKLKEVRNFTDEDFAEALGYKIDDFKRIMEGKKRLDTFRSRILADMAKTYLSDPGVQPKLGDGSDSTT